MYFIISFHSLEYFFISESFIFLLTVLRISFLSPVSIFSISIFLNIIMVIIIKNFTIKSFALI